MRRPSSALLLCAAQTLARNIESAAELGEAAIAISAGGGTLSADASGMLSAKVWRGASGDGALDFPEQRLEELRARPNSAVSFSGGGVRAFSATLGYLVALHELELLPRARYMAGVSGGAWAATAYTYVDPSAGPHVARNDTELLGRALPPHAVSYAALDDMPAASARHCATVGVGFVPLPGAGYATKIQDTFLSPLGVRPGASWSYDAQSADSILQRNEGRLAKSQLALPLRRSYGAPPFLLMGITLMGPLASAPLSLSRRNYSVIDATPLYFGQARPQPITFNSRPQLGKPQIPSVVLPVGGLIEPFAVGGEAPRSGLRRGLTESVLPLPAPAAGPFPLATALAASSFFPGDVEGWLSKDIADKLGFKLPLWPSAEPSPRTTDMLIGDGGLCENTLVSSLLRRGVDRIVLFQSTDTPLRAGWDPHRRPPTANDVDDELAAYFGVFVNNASHPGYTYRSNHFFEEAEFAPLVLALQASQRSGRGAVASAELTTVRNDCAGPRPSTIHL